MCCDSVTWQTNEMYGHWMKVYRSLTVSLCGSCCLLWTWQTLPLPLLWWGRQTLPPWRWRSPWNQNRNLSILYHFEYTPMPMPPTKNKADEYEGHQIYPVRVTFSNAKQAEFIETCCVVWVVPLESCSFLWGSLLITDCWRCYARAVLYCVWVIFTLGRGLSLGTQTSWTYMQ